MNILNYFFSEDSWVNNLECTNRDEAISSMIKKICTNSFQSQYPDLPIETIIKSVIERENDRSTHMGHQIAFPHARLPGLKRAVFSIATLKKPVLFEEKEVRIICLMLIPLSDSSISLKLMAYMSRFLSETVNREKVLAADSFSDFKVIFTTQTIAVDQPIMAKDIMRPPKWSINESTLLSECSKMMSDFQLYAIPVLNKDNRISGEITSDHLFNFGVPEFFSRLKSVSFIAEFDPFEKYFQKNREITVSEIMNPKPKIISREQTIMEIIFDLSVKNYPKLYVEDNLGNWVGTIDSGIVLHKVINLG